MCGIHWGQGRGERGAAAGALLAELGMSLGAGLDLEEQKGEDLVSLPTSLAGIMS